MEIFVAEVAEIAFGAILTATIAGFLEECRVQQTLDHHAVAELVIVENRVCVAVRTVRLERGHVQAGVAHVAVVVNLV